MTRGVFSSFLSIVHCTHSLVYMNFVRKIPKLAATMHRGGGGSEPVLMRRTPKYFIETWQLQRCNGYVTPALSRKTEMAMSPLPSRVPTAGRNMQGKSEKKKLFALGTKKNFPALLAISAMTP